MELEADTAQQCEQWLKALRWVQEQESSSGIGAPFQAQHNLHVSTDFTWSAPVASAGHPSTPSADGAVKPGEAEGKGLEDSFELLDLLGHGTFGRVHKAVHKATGFELAVKLVYVDDTLSRDEIKQEVNILKLCRHPNIVNCESMWFYFYL